MNLNIENTTINICFIFISIQSAQIDYTTCTTGLLFSDYTIATYSDIVIIVFPLVFARSKKNIIWAKTRISRAMYIKLECCYCSPKTFSREISPCACMEYINVPNLISLQGSTILKRGRLMTRLFRFHLNLSCIINAHLNFDTVNSMRHYVHYFMKYSWNITVYSCRYNFSLILVTCKKTGLFFIKRIIGI